MNKAIKVNELPIVFAVKLWKPSGFHQWVIIAKADRTLDLGYITAFWNGKSNHWDLGHYGFDFISEAMENAIRRGGWCEDASALIPNIFNASILRTQNEVYNFFNKGE